MMIDAPSVIDETQLDELNLQLQKATTEAEE